MIAIVLLLEAAPVDPPLTARMHATPACPTATEPAGGDVVVCGRLNDEQFRLPKLNPRYEKPVDSRAAAAIPGIGKVAAETEGVMIGGVPSNRIMVRLKVPF